jgi:plasmid stabilization system protein ParE
MPRHKYHTTATAESHFWEALRNTKEFWGEKQAEKYRIKFLQGLQYIADNHQKIHSYHRKKLAEGTDFSLHLVEQRYVVYQTHDKYNVIIAGIFHEQMDIPKRLEELQKMSKAEISALKKALL